MSKHRSQESPRESKDCFLSVGFFTALIYYFITLKLFDCLRFCLRGSFVQITKTILESFFFWFQHIFAELLHYHNMFNEPSISLVQRRGKFKGVEKLLHRYIFLTVANLASRRWCSTLSICLPEL